MSKAFSSNISGNVGVVMALALVPLILAVGMAVDYARAKTIKAKMQSALDATVLSLATEKTLTADQVTTRGVNFFNDMFDVTSRPTTAFTISDGFINGTATYAMPTSFMGIINLKTFGVSAASQAKIGSEPSPCIILLESTQISLTINGASELRAGCGVHINSSNSEALYVNSQSKISATDICIKGSYRLNSGSTSSPTPRMVCPIKADPLAALAEPTHGTCNFTDLVISGGPARTLNPGVYCKKLEIQNGAVVTLKPGTYVFSDAELIVNAGAKLSGDGVMLYFKGEHGFLNANTGAVVQLEAPDSGTYKGIVLFQSRSSSSQLAPPHIINSDSTSFLEGIIYAPYGKLMMNSSSTLNMSADYTAIIARTMEINSLSTFVGNANYGGSTPVSDKLNLAPTSTGPRLVK